MEEEQIRNWLIIAIVNAFLGLLLFEWAWFKTRRSRAPIYELSAQFPEMSRPDALRWQKWKFYPGAVTLLLPRLLFAIGTFVWVSILMRICMIGYTENGPMSRARHFIVRWVGQGHT